MYIVGFFQKISELWALSWEDYIFFQGDQMTPDALKHSDLATDLGILK